MKDQRYKAKMTVTQRQMMWFPASNDEDAGYYTSCYYCTGKHPTDAHEVWISRADVSGREDLIQAVTTEPMNIVLLHNQPCHIPKAEGAHGRFAMLLVDIYGKDAIIGWINRLGLKNSIPYVNLVLAVPDLITKENV